MDIWRKNLPGCGSSKSKGPEVGVDLVFGKKSVTRVERRKRR